MKGRLKWIFSHSYAFGNSDLNLIKNLAITLDYLKSENLTYFYEIETNSLNDKAIVKIPSFSFFEVILKGTEEFVSSVINLTDKFSL
jgi:hypothetical protein